MARTLLDDVLAAARKDRKLQLKRGETEQQKAARDRYEEWLRERSDEQLKLMGVYVPTRRKPQ